MRRKKINFKGICIATFVVALVCTILANIMIPKNDIASSFKFPLLIVSVVLLVILLVLSKAIILHCSQIQQHLTIF